MKITVHCGIGFSGSEHRDVMEIPDEEIAGMSEDDKKDYIMSEYVVPWANQYFESWYEEKE